MELFLISSYFKNDHFTLTQPSGGWTKLSNALNSVTADKILGSNCSVVVSQKPILWSTIN